MKTKIVVTAISLLAVSLVFGCAGSLGNVSAPNPIERGLSYIAAAIISHAIISLFR